MTPRAMRLCSWGALLAMLLAACGDSSSDDPGTSVPAATTPAVTPPAVTPPLATTPASPSPSASPSKRTSPGGTRPSSSAPHTPSAHRKVAPGKDFTLAVGESARIDGTDVVVTFARLVEDSRCPTGVTCIRAGEALIAVTVRGPGEPATFQLQVPAAEGGSAGTGNEKRVGKYVLSLQSVDPYPVAPAAGTTAAPEVAPTATLRVTRA